MPLIRSGMENNPVFLFIELQMPADMPDSIKQKRVSHYPLFSDGVSRAQAKGRSHNNV
jgi:hypothetical protein